MDFSFEESGQRAYAAMLKVYVHVHVCMYVHVCQFFGSCLETYICCCNIIPIAGQWERGGSS